MKVTRTVAALLWAAALLGWATLLTVQGANSEASIQDVELQGNVVCLAEAMHQLYQTELSAEHEHIYGFKANDGSFYTLLRTKFSDALFVDPELRKKTLLLKGRVFPKTRIFDVMRIRSIKNGTVFDIFYYCTVCNIETVSPGECACCREPVELKEKPLRERGQSQAQTAPN